LEILDEFAAAAPDAPAAAVEPWVAARRDSAEQRGLDVPVLPAERR
jgi:hypothetical protein